MVENDMPDPGGKIDPSEDAGADARASAPGQEKGGGIDERDNDRKKDEPGAASKGINPVQHSE